MGMRELEGVLAWVQYRHARKRKDLGFLFPRAYLSNALPIITKRIIYIRPRERNVLDESICVTT